MSKEGIEGATQKGVGAVKEAAGKMTGNEKLRAEGVADRAAGSVKEAVSARPRTPSIRRPDSNTKVDTRGLRSIGGRGVILSNSNREYFAMAGRSKTKAA